MPFQSDANLNTQLLSHVTHKPLPWPSFQRRRTLNPQGSAHDSGTRVPRRRHRPPTGPEGRLSPYLISPERIRSTGAVTTSHPLSLSPQHGPEGAGAANTLRGAGCRPTEGPAASRARPPTHLLLTQPAVGGLQVRQVGERLNPLHGEGGGGRAAALPRRRPRARRRGRRHLRIQLTRFPPPSGPSGLPVAVPEHLQSLGSARKRRILRLSRRCTLKGV